MQHFDIELIASVQLDHHRLLLPPSLSLTIFAQVLHTHASFFRRCKSGEIIPSALRAAEPSPGHCCLSDQPGELKKERGYPPFS